MATVDLLSALADGNFSASIKQLDLLIQKGGSQLASSQSAQLHLNRGFCNQKLQLYRKALKVGGAETEN